jgi:hypothetical protein
MKLDRTEVDLKEMRTAEISTQYPQQIVSNLMANQSRHQVSGEYSGSTKQCLLEENEIHAISETPGLQEIPSSWSV